MKKDSSWFMAEIIGYPINLDDRWVCLEIVSDINERKGTEDGLHP